MFGTSLQVIQDVTRDIELRVRVSGFQKRPLAACDVPLAPVGYGSYVLNEVVGQSLVVIICELPLLQSAIWVCISIVNAFRTVVALGGQKT